MIMRRRIVNAANQWILANTRYKVLISAMRWHWHWHIFSYYMIDEFGISFWISILYLSKLIRSGWCCKWCCSHQSSKLPVKEICFFFIKYTNHLGGIITLTKNCKIYFNISSKTMKSISCIFIFVLIFCKILHQN